MPCSIIADGDMDSVITDDIIYTYKAVKSICFSSSKGLYGLYIKYDRLPSSFVITADNVCLPFTQTDYLHHYIELNGQKNVVINYSESSIVSDAFAFETTSIPNWVQRWETLDKADILICPTHSDDDQLYFAGMIPWCASNGYMAQVVYFTNHWNTHDRPHETLDGLWHCGLKYYPVVSSFPDLYSTSLEQARSVFSEYGYVEDDFISFYISLFVKYNPLVVVAHDINGEYGHGAHMLNTASIIKAVDISASQKIWNVPKTYIHLWNDNKVNINWDIPLQFFEGKTAFTISKEAFEFHTSQHRFTSLYNWINGTEYSPITKAAEIRRYSPCNYGLYRTTVGVDTKENGLFDNLHTYSELKADAKMLKKIVLLSADSKKEILLKKHCPKYVHLPLNIIGDQDLSDDRSQVIIHDDNQKHLGILFLWLLFLICIFATIIASRLRHRG